jgi:hypothetical protein
VPIPELDLAPRGTVTPPTAEPVGSWRALAGMGSCYWAAALVVAAVAFVAIAVPTAVIPNPVFGRLVATRWWDPVLLAASSLLLGMVWAARGAPGGSSALDPSDLDVSDRIDPDEQVGRRRSVAAGLLTFLAVGCPTCNKLVLVALGTSGALSWFAPIQPVLGVAAIAMLALTLRRRLRAVGPLSCSA